MRIIAGEAQHVLETIPAYIDINVLEIVGRDPNIALDVVGGLSGQAITMLRTFEHCHRFVPKVHGLAELADPVGAEFNDSKAKVWVAVEDTAEHHGRNEILRGDMAVDSGPGIHLELGEHPESVEDRRLAPTIIA